MNCLIARFSLLVAAMTFAACASKPIESFGDGRPLFQPEKYFAGKTRSHGVFETPSGNPTRLIQTETTGVWDGTVLHFEQDLTFEGGKKMHRSWRVSRLDDHRYSATGTGIVGTARGEAYGNVFHLDFTLDAFPGNPLGHVRMRQWMYLQPDGRTMVNRATLTKAGVVVAQITEQFRKER